MATTEAVFQFAAGIDRRPPRVSESATVFEDMDGLVPEAHGGVTVFGEEEAANVLAAQTWGHAFQYYNGASWEAYGIGTSGVSRLTSSPSALYSSASSGASVPSAALRKGSIALANPPNPLVLIPVSNPSSAEEISAAPLGNVVENFFGALWVAGCTSDIAIPPVSIPLYCYGLPAPSPGDSKTGTGNVSAYKLTDSSGAPNVFTGAVGKIILIGGDAYKIKAVSTVHATNDTVEVYPVNDQPDDGTGYSWELLPGNIFDVAPASLDFGECSLFTDTATVSLRVKNQTGSKQTILGVVPSGPEVILVSLPSFPLTVAPGGTATFQVKMRPQEVGARPGSVVVNIGSEAQSSLSAPLTCTGSLSKLLHVSAIDFGAVMTGTSGQEQTVTLTNSTGMDVALKAGQWSLSNGFTLTSPASFPGQDVILRNGESYTLKLKASPSSSGSLSGSLTFQRVIKANPGRVWFSSPTDPKSWDLDTDWVDVASVGQSSTILAMVAYDSSLWVFTRDRCVLVQPGGAGKFRIVQGDGFFFGAWSRASICTGGGRLWWAGPEGVFVASGSGVKRVSDKIHDVARGALSAAVAWMGDMLAVAFDYQDSETEKSIWFYAPDSDSWFRKSVTHFPSILTPRSPTELVGISGNAAYLYGSGYSQAAPAKFKAKTKSMVLSYPNNKKRVLSGRFFLSDPSTIKRMVFRGSEGQLTWAEFQEKYPTPGLVVYGSGRVTALNGSIDASEILGANADMDFAGCSVFINRAQYSVSASSGPVLTCVGVPNGEHIAIIAGPSQAKTLTRSYYCPNSTGGGAIAVEISGETSEKGKTLDLFTLQYDVTAGVVGNGLDEIIGG